jgi:hypothetical protein
MATMVAATDFALHNELTTLDELRDVLAFCRRWPGAGRAASRVRPTASRSSSNATTSSQKRIRQEALERLHLVIVRWNWYEVVHTH